MAVKLRLARWGAKKNPYYHIVASDSRSPRDGKFLETVGKYNPLADGDLSSKASIKEDRVKYWLGVGAQPTDKVVSILAKLGLLDNPSITSKTKKNQPKAKAQARLESQKSAESTPVAESTEAVA